MSNERNHTQNIVHGRNPLKDLNNQNIGAGLVSGALAFTGPPVIILEAASNGNFSMEHTILWMFSVYFFGGLLSIILPWVYKIPITAAHSITGVAFLATVTSQFTFHELIGAYILSGVIILLVGIFGVFQKLLNYVPKEIIGAMMAGLITSYVVRLIVSVHNLPLIGGSALLTFFVFMKWSKRVPPVIAAFVVGFIMLFLTRDLNGTGLETAFVLPTLQLPDFNMLSFLSVSIPLVLLILSNDAAPGIGAIEQNDYKAPTNRIITLSGIFSILASFFGGQSSNVAGMMSAITSGDEAGPRNKRYVASMVSGFMLLFFGIFAWKVVPFIQMLPLDFVAMLAGFALLGVLGGSLNVGFSKPEMRLSTTFAFIIALSNISIFYINAPVWALVGGAIIARTIEKKKDEFQINVEANEAEMR